jgi:hypothetical protein
LLASHACVLAVCAAGCAAAAHHRDSATPVFAVFGFALAALSCSLPSGNPHSRVARWKNAIAFAVVSAAVWATPELRLFAQAHAAVVGLAGLALAALFFRSALSRAALRSADPRLFTAGCGGLAGNPSARQAAMREHWRTSRIVGRSWTHGAVGQSSFHWLRALWHENYGALPRRRLALSALWIVAIALVVPGVVLRAATPEPVSARELAMMLYSTVYAASAADRDIFALFGVTTTVMTVMFFTVLAVMFAQPRTQHVSVLSREGRARLTHLSSAAQIGLLLFAFGAIGAGAPWVAALAAGIPFQPTGLPPFLRMMLGTLPLLPLWQWYALAEITPRPLATKFLAILGLIGALVGGGAVGFSDAPPAILWPCLVLAIAIGQLAHRSAVRRLFRRADLAGSAP